MHECVLSYFCHTPNLIFCVIYLVQLISITNSISTVKDNEIIKINLSHLQ